jgi:serine/threonine-protein kinase
VSVRPAPGASVRTSSHVVVTVSQGPKLFEVPDLAKMTRDEATAAITKAGLKVGTVAEAWSEDVPEGAVVSQQTPTSPPLRSGSAVDFTVSKGREPVPVPPVVGKAQQAAQDAVKGAGLAVGSVSNQPSDTVPSGAVISQSPASGTLFHGDKVSLVVSSGPPVVDVPNVVNSPLEQAQSALQAAGLQVQVNKVFGGLLGIVRAQDPPGGQVRKGSTVTITVV